MAQCARDWAQVFWKSNTYSPSYPLHFLKSYYVFKLKILLKLSSAGSNCTSVPSFPAPTTRWSVCLNCTHCLLIFTHNLGELLYQHFYQPQTYPLMYYIHKQFQLIFFFRYDLNHAALASLELHRPGWLDWRVTCLCLCSAGIKVWALCLELSISSALAFATHVSLWTALSLFSYSNSCTDWNYLSHLKDSLLP